jgi:predicted acylesterase/phospholipase RssA
MGHHGDKLMTCGDEQVHAVVLSGGGAYGAYEVGAMKALFSGDSPVTHYAPLNARVFTGTSVGSFNAAFMTTESGVESSLTAARLEALWIEQISDNPQTCGNSVFRFRANPFAYLQPECFATNPVKPFAELGADAAFFAEYLFTRGTEFFLSSGNIARRALHLVDLSAFISIDPLKRLIERTIKMGSIRNSDRLLRVAATNWNTGEVKIFENKDMTEEFGPLIIQASASIPGIFPPVNIAGYTYVDGGVVMNTPLKCALEAGATTLHIIYNDPDVESIPVERLENTLDTFMKMFTIMLATIANEDIDTAAWINEGLEAIERLSSGGDMNDADMAAFIRVAARIKERLEKGTPYRKLTIHRYRPEGELGGDLGVLDFRQPVILRSIEQGLNDVLHHDCATSHCILPIAVCK